MILTLAENFTARGLQVDLLLSRVRGTHDRQVPKSLQPIRLRRASDLEMRRALFRAAGKDLPIFIQPALLSPFPSWALRYLPPLAEYLSERRPTALLTANSWPNLVALLANRLAGGGTRVVTSERIHLSERVRHLRRHARWRCLPKLITRLYPEAGAITAVSEGVADDLAVTTGLPRETVRALPNPVVSRRMLDMAAEPCAHPWLARRAPPVILGVGRLHEQKDFPTLVQAFARVRRERDVRLVILGEGEERPALERLVRRLGIAADVDMPGFVDNPYAYMSRAAVFALSSRYEGLPGVLIQAMACGCPSVSTDCPSGPGEILRNGALGPLVPVGEARRLAEGIAVCLDSPVPRLVLQKGVAVYSVESATDCYLEALMPKVWPPSAVAGTPVTRSA